MIPGHGRSNARARVVTRAVAVTALISLAALMGTSPAYAGVTSAGASTIADAIKASGTTVTGASFVTVPSGTPNGVADSSLGGFPTDGSTFAILTNGNVGPADNAPPDSDDAVTNLGGGNIRGNTDVDVTILKIDFTVPQNMNCVRFDFRFFTEEWDEFVNATFNDAFIAELDTSNWTTSGATITAPENFAFDPSGQAISVDAAGNTSMSDGPNDTTYDGATPLLTAAHAADPGPHSLYLSIFDQNSHLADSAVFVDNLVVGHAVNEQQCAEGAKPKAFAIELAPPTGSHAVGGSHTVTATVTEVDGGAVSGGKVVFSVSGANTDSGTVTTNGSGAATFTYSGSHPGDDVITACYSADDDGTCDVGEPFASVAATWTPPTSTPSPTAAPTGTPTAAPTTTAPAGGGGNGGLANTGAPVALIAGIGAALIVVGTAGYVMIRRRRVHFTAE